MSAEPIRLDLTACRALLEQRLAEPAPARIQLLTGPRQVGKTTLLLELAQSFGEAGIYAAADGPEMSLPGSWERLWTRAEDAARAHGKAGVFLDEAPHIHDWAGRLKSTWDRLRRARMKVHVVASGSSALHLGRGSKESLAGRFERITLSHWSARAIASTFGMTDEASVDLLVRQGAYPGAMEYRKDAQRWSAYIRDSIVEPAVGRDILALSQVRRPALLRQAFAYCTSSPAQIISLQKMQGDLHGAGALETIAHYLDLLEEAFLVAVLRKHSPRPARQRAAPPKLVTLNNAFLAALDPRGAPEHATDPERYGAWVENAVLAHAWNQGQSVKYWREEPFEVDGVLAGSWGKWAIEVKTGAVELRGLRGLAAFHERHPEYRPLILCEDAQVSAAKRLGFEARSWRRFLLEGL